MSEPNVILCLALVAAGMVVHATTKLRELEQGGNPVSAIEYLRRNPWTAINVALSAYGMFLLQWYTGEGGPIAAFLTGIACNSLGDKLRARAQAVK